MRNEIWLPLTKRNSLPFFQQNKKKTFMTCLSLHRHLLMTCKNCCFKRKHPHAMYKLSLLILRLYRSPQNNSLSERPAKNSTESILRTRCGAEFIIKYAWYFNVKHDTPPRENLRNMAYLQ